MIQGWSHFRALGERELAGRRFGQCTDIFLYFILVCVMSCDSHVNLDDSLSRAHYILDIAAVLVITGPLTGWGHFPGTPGSPGVSSS